LVETLVSSNGSTTVSKQTAAGEPDQAFCNKA